MKWRLRDLSIATTVLSVVVAVTVAVTMLGVNMYNTVDNAASVAEDLAYGLARDIVSEQGRFLALSIETRVFRPVREVVELGRTTSLMLGNAPLSWAECLFVMRSMLVHLEAGAYVFPHEGWIVNVVNGTTTMTVKGYLDDDGKRVMIRFINDTAAWFWDRYPVPLDTDMFFSKPRKNKAFGEDYIREDKAIAYIWGEVNGNDPTGMLEMGFGGPILPGTIDNNIFIFTEVFLDILRPLLQSIIGGGEPLMVGQYNNTGYAPILNETILCILEAPTGLLLECTHGFASINMGSVWHRVVATESEHPIIGPGIRVATAIDKNTGSREHVFSTSGTGRFPLQDHIRYFIDIEPLSNGPLWSRVVITPYDALLREVEEHTDKERDHARNIIVVVIVLAVGVTMAAITAAGFISVRISKPIMELVRDMRRVELMDVDAVKTTQEGPASIVIEVEKMRKSFLTMVAMLVEYKSFIPRHLVLEESDSVPQEMRKSTAWHSDVMQLFALELTTRQCSVGTLVMEQISQEDVLSRAYNTVLEAILEASQGMEPNVNLTFDSIVVSFNATTRLFSYGEKGLKVMRALSQLNASSLIVGSSYEIATAAVGNVGTTTSRFSVVCPDNSVRTRVVPQYAVSHEQDLLEGDTSAIWVSRLVGDKPQQDEEWMYTLQKTENLPHTIFNTAFQDMLAGNFRAAIIGFENCIVSFERESARFLALMSEYKKWEGDPSWYRRRNSLL